MNEEAIFDLLGCIVGAAAGLLGLMSIAETHRDSSFWNRAIVGLLTILCFNVALDGWLAMDIPGRSVNHVGVAFSFCLAVSWGYRKKGALAGRRSP